MTAHSQNHIRDLIDRISRINASDEWGEEINPSQWTALSYLARANRFSRTPSQVADYMAATRGTVSQTLKALARKDLVQETRSDRDRRSISYSLTDRGKALIQKIDAAGRLADTLEDADVSALQAGLEELVRTALKQRGMRPFGICRTCMHHRKTDTGGFCSLLQETLSRPEAGQICHEHAEAA